MNINISPTVRVSFGLIMLTVSILFIGDWMGLIPREQTLELEHRKKFSESLAVQFSSLAQTGDMRHIRTTLEAIVDRNEDVESAAFRSLIDDGVTVEAGDHATAWTLGENAQYSTVDEVVVPIFKDDQRWGSVEVKFAEGSTAWYAWFSRHSFASLVLFVTASGFLLYMLFMRRILRELDPSQVVPERVKAAFDSLAEGVLILDEQGHIVLANTAFSENAVVDGSQIMGASASKLNWSTYRTSTKVRDDRFPWARVLGSGKAVKGERLTIHKDSDIERSYTINCTPIHDDKEKVRGVITTFDDLTELEKRNESLKDTLTELKQTQTDVDLKNKELQYLATRDPLTNCLNRRAFTEQYSLLYEAATSNKLDLVCVMVDIDHFKRINDNYGHALGDKVIKFVAETLKKAIRRNDLLGRYGGEEFCLILEGASIDQAVMITERMRKSIITGDPSVFTSALRVSASFGLASISDEPDDKDELVNKADKALYLAKESGRNKVEVWDGESIAGAPAQESTEREPGAQKTDLRLVAGGLENDTAERIRQLEKIAEEKAEQLDHYVAYDPLTQLPVRHLFVDRVEQALYRAKRDGGVLAVVSLGLQNLRRVNDTLGHDSAQQLLKETADRLGNVLRDSDTISLLSATDNDASISKLSEGEFGLMLPSVKDNASITWIVKRIFDALQEPLYINEHNVTITSNVGIGVYPADGDDAATLIKHASISRHYAEQQAGVNNVEYFSEHINRISREQLHLESEMSGAIENEEFEVLYQPKIDLQTGEVTGFESLLRWNHPQRGLLTPNEFIDIAERTRMINLIGDWVLEQSCRQIVEFGRNCSRKLSIAVNLSPVQFSQPDLVKRILYILHETGMDPSLLELELTESCLMENMDETFQALVKLQAHGVNISIDDFGTGYSGLSYLRTLPINILKVDRRFVADIGANSHDTAIVAAIVSMAKALGLKVIAEGVETRRQLDVLAGMACDEAQGYLFSRPIAAEAARELLVNDVKLVGVG